MYAGVGLDSPDHGRVRIEGDDLDDTVELELKRPNPSSLYQIVKLSQIVVSSSKLVKSCSLKSRQSNGF